MSFNILVLLANNVEEIELITPIDLWRRIGYQVTIASIHQDKTITGQQNIVIQADNILEKINYYDFDCLFIPGGSGHLLIKQNELAMSVIDYFIKQKKWICAICAAPTILATHLSSYKATCYPSMKEMIPNWIDSPVVIDHHFITSQGAGTAHLLALALIETVDSLEKAILLQQQTLFK